jgi:phosphatidylglycerol---prolipoprotein diacylglyceryl transferase
MIPKLFQLGPIPVYSYGLMLGICFIVASWLLSKEFKRKKLDENAAINVTFIALLGGVIGSKLLYVIEEWGSIMSMPVGRIFSTEGLFSPAGLTFYGGLILAAILIFIYARVKKIPFLRIADATAPSLAIGYGIARVGCHLSGDGDYGLPVSEFMSWVPWGTDYSNGTLPPSIAFRGTELAQKFGGVVPDNTLCHPTPIYELIIAIIIFSVLWAKRKVFKMDGKLFGLYLMLSGAARLLVEFIRLNPKLLFGLSEAQVISILLILLGIYLYYRTQAPEIQPQTNQKRTSKKTSKK